MKKIISMLLAVVMCFSLITVSFAAEMNFTDVKSSDWFYNDVKSAVEMGLVNGKSATTYAPNDNLTYAEAIKLAACMNMLYLEGKVDFESGSPWYKPYVNYCIDNGIITKEYNYTENASRGGYMEIFANALPDEGLKEINNVPSNSIPDVQMASYYAEGVYKLYRAGILTGVDAEHRCNPHANITRAEVAAILTRMMNEGKRVSITDMAKEEIKEEEKKEEVKEEVKKEETKPEETKPEVKEPEVKEPEVKEPEVKEPEVKEPEVKEEVVALEVKNLTGAELEIPDDEKGEVKVKATGGKGAYTYTWEYNSGDEWKTIVFGGGDQYTFVSGKNSDTITILVSTKDFSKDMKIRCTVTDEAGNSVTSAETHTIAIANAEPLVIKTQPISRFVEAGDEVTFTVKVEGGTAPYTYKWQTNRNGGEFYDINKSTFTYQEGFDTATYKVTISQVVLDNKQGFRCVITDADGNSITSNDVTVSAPEVKTESKPRG